MAFLVPYVPHTIMHNLANKRITSTPGNEYNNVVDTFDSSVVFCDASGFTVLTQKLAEQQDGSELLSAILNRFFDPLLRLIDRYPQNFLLNKKYCFYVLFLTLCLRWGGDVIKFSGDALTIIWPICDIDNCPRDMAGKEI